MITGLGRDPWVRVVGRVWSGNAQSVPRWQRPGADAVSKREPGVVAWTRAVRECTKRYKTAGAGRSVSKDQMKTYLQWGVFRALNSDLLSPLTGISRRVTGFGTWPRRGARRRQRAMAPTKVHSPRPLRYGRPLLGYISPVPSRIWIFTW